MARARARTSPGTVSWASSGAFRGGKVLAFWPRLVWTLLDGKSAEIGFFLSFLLILHVFSFAFGPVKRRSDTPYPLLRGLPAPSPARITGSVAFITAEAKFPSP